MFNYYKSKQLR